MITIKIGNLFESTAKTLVNTVNCVGIMGKGIAEKFKKRNPAMFEDYVKRCNAGLVKLGKPYLYADLLGTSIINFPTKDHWRSVSKVQDIKEGLDYFIAHYQEWKIESIAFPPLGCGNGGLEWSTVGPIMVAALSPLPIKVEMFAPFGTPAYQLTEEYLRQGTPAKTSVKGVYLPKMKDEWLVPLEVVYQLSKQPYANAVGRTIFQKICYIITEMGVDTGFNFSKGSYGPFSAELKIALNVAANANLIQERQLGKITALLTTTEYESQRMEFAPRIARYEKKINKTVDLFSRIKNTDQAEEVTTVIFASKQLKMDRPKNHVSEADVLDYILDWKKAWNNDDKTESVGSTIRNLAILRWVDLEYSESLPSETF